MLVLKGSDDGRAQAGSYHVFSCSLEGIETATSWSNREYQRDLFRVVQPQSLP